MDGSGEYSAEAIEAIRRGYLVNAKLFDEAFGRVLRAVRELGEWERTIIVFHGDQDKTVHPANGDQLMVHARDNTDAMAVEPGHVPDGHAFTRTTHKRADGKVHAEHWVIHGAGHAWSGGSAHGSYTDGKGPDASREMLRFFTTQR